MYEVIRQNGTPQTIRRLSDQSDIPLDPANRDFREFLIWNMEQPEPLNLSPNQPTE